MASVRVFGTDRITHEMILLGRSKGMIAHVPSASERALKGGICLAWDRETKERCGKKITNPHQHGWTCGDHQPVRAPRILKVDSRSPEECLRGIMQREVDRSLTSREGLPHAAKALKVVQGIVLHTDPPEITDEDLDEEFFDERVGG
jgi:hypothetical protein